MCFGGSKSSNTEPPPPKPPTTFAPAPETDEMRRMAAITAGVQQGTTIGTTAPAAPGTYGAELGRGG